jgi:hypothetical protein
MRTDPVNTVRIFRTTPPSARWGQNTAYRTSASIFYFDEEAEAEAQGFALYARTQTIEPPTDPVGNGLVASLAQPGGNMTGLAGIHSGEEVRARQHYRS